jgi:hypothetical protein
MGDMTYGGRRSLLLAVAGLMCVAAALAIGILLLGDFGGTEGRILGTTLLLAVHGALAVPAAILWDQRRLAALAAACAGLAALAATLNVVALWSDSGDTFGKAIGTVMFFLIATVVTTALATRPLHRLFPASVALAAVAASMATAAVWTETEREGYLRLLAAIVVLDVLLVALQPLLLRARRTRATLPLRVVDTSGRSTDVSVQAESLAAAVAKAIRDVERRGSQVRSVEVLDRIAGTNGSPRR